MRKIICSVSLAACFLLIGCTKAPVESQVEIHSTTIATESELVTFMDENGSVILETSAGANGRPTQIPVGSVMLHRYFKGWEPEPGEISSGTYVARYKDVSNELNAIGFDSLYVQGQQETVLQIRLEGNPNFAVLSCQLEIPIGLRFISVDQCDGYAICHYNEESRLLKIAFASPENLESCIELCTVRIAPENGEAGKIQPILTVLECEKYDLTGKNFEEVEYTVTCGTVHIIQ